MTPLLRTIRDVEASGDRALLQSTWNNTCTALFAERQEFHGFTWDVMDAAFPAAWRTAQGVCLPSLGRRGEAVVADTFLHRPGMERLPEELQWRVRALGRRIKDTKTAVEVLTAVQGLGGWSSDALGALFRRAPATLRAWERGIADSEGEQG